MIRSTITAVLLAGAALLCDPATRVALAEAQRVLVIVDDQPITDYDV